MDGQLKVKRTRSAFRYTRHCYKLVPKNSEISSDELTKMVLDLVKNGPKGIENVKVLNNLNNHLVILSYLKPVRIRSDVPNSDYFEVERFKYQKLVKIIDNFQLVDNSVTLTEPMVTPLNN